MAVQQNKKSPSRRNMRRSHDGLQAGALALEPTVLMLDEPSLGLAPLIVKDVFEVLTSLRTAGVSILLVEQNARAALHIADYAYVMELGSITAQGRAAEIAKDERLVESYLGLGGKHY